MLRLLHSSSSSRSSAVAAPLPRRARLDVMAQNSCNLINNNGKKQLFCFTSAIHFQIYHKSYRSDRTSNSNVNLSQTFSTMTITQHDKGGRQQENENDDSNTTKACNLQAEISDAHGRQNKVWLRKRRRQPQQIEADDNDEYGVYARCYIVKGDIVMEGRARSPLFNSVESPNSIFANPGTHTIQVNWKKHIKLDLPSRFVNHICGLANVGIQKPPNVDDESNSNDDDTAGDIVYYNFIALTDISIDEEILWDYECSEYELLNGGFQCSCGSPYCRNQIRGYKYNNGLVIKAYGKEYIASYLTN